MKKYSCSLAIEVYAQYVGATVQNQKSKLYETQPKQILSQRIYEYTQQRKAVLIFLLKWSFHSLCSG